MWGDIAISLIQRGLQAPHKVFFRGEIPHKCGELENNRSREKQLANDRKIPKKAILWGDYGRDVGRFPTFWEVVGSLQAAPGMG